MIECRRKGIPQAKYCKNGFIYTSMRLLSSSLSRQCAFQGERQMEEWVCVRTFQWSLEEASQILWRSRHIWKNGTSAILWFRSFLSISNCFKPWGFWICQKTRSPVFQLKLVCSLAGTFRALVWEAGDTENSSFSCCPRTSLFGAVSCLSRAAGSQCPLWVVMAGSPCVIQQCWHLPLP